MWPQEFLKLSSVEGRLAFSEKYASKQADSSAQEEENGKRKIWCSKRPQPRFLQDLGTSLDFYVGANKSGL